MDEQARRWFEQAQHDLEAARKNQAVALTTSALQTIMQEIAALNQSDSASIVSEDNRDGDVD
jgi:hypothetical protein